MFMAGYGTRTAQTELGAYFKSLADSQTEEYLDPIAFFVIYSIWKEKQAPHRTLRLRAADALSAFRCFPHMERIWLTSDDTIDQKVKVEGLDKDSEEEDDDDESDDDDELLVELLPSHPEFQWQLAKSNHSLLSPSMDKLMALTGMRDVKSRAMNVCKEVLLSKKRPANVKTQVAMNFLFVGNPGSGIGTVYLFI